jgi:DNA-binding beta-propeller fold protein YncE
MRREGLTMKRGARIGRLTLALAGLVAIGACDGPNRFSGPVDIAADRPRVEILIPRSDSAAVPLNDSILVEARFRDNTGVDSVQFVGESLRGDPSLGTGQVVERFELRTVVLPSPRDTTLGRFLLPTADTLREFTSLIARGFDRDQNVGADTLLVQLGGPAVRILDLLDGQTVQSGLALNLSGLARDPEGVVSVQFDLEGSVNQTIVRNFNPPTDSVVVDTTVAIPAAASGPFTLTLRGTNLAGLTGVDGPITLNASTVVGASDTIAPRLGITVEEKDRVELGDSVVVNVTGQDDIAGSGVVTAGYSVVAFSPARGDSVVFSETRTFAPARTGQISTNFGIPILNVDSLGLPDTLVYEVTGFMIDGAGNCGSAVSDQGTLTCGTFPSGETRALDRDGFSETFVVVAGQTVLLPQGSGGSVGGTGMIMDAAVDTARRNLFLSNIQAGRVEVFRLDTETFGTAIGVGSEPWGMDFTRNGDSLWVANSGGTNFSVVDLNTEREVENDRLLTPDVILYDVELQAGDASTAYVCFPIPQRDPGAAFSDEPQFMSVDAFGNVIYSTKTTPGAEFGTARKAFYPVGTAESEVRLFVEHGVLTPTDNFWAFAHVDSIGCGTQSITLFDHQPGFPNNVISATAFLLADETPEDAAIDLAGQGSDVLIVPGSRWQVPSVGFADTTFVARSGDGNWVAIGEGGVSPLARVLMYEAQPGATTALSGLIPVADLLTNAAEEVRGLAVNYDGTLATARGREGAYFFTVDLREQGFTRIALPGEAKGAAFHPLHANYRGTDNLGGQYRPDIHLAFVSSGNRTIDVIDTQRFAVIGQVTIRDNIVGPLRAILPFPSDNAGRTCATTPVQDRFGNTVGNAIRLYNGNDFTQPIDPAGATEDSCVVIKLFGVSDSGGVVIVPVRKADILRSHPARLTP